MQGEKENWRGERKWCTHGAQLLKRSGFCSFTLDPVRNFLHGDLPRTIALSHTCALPICYGQMINCQMSNFMFTCITGTGGQSSEDTMKFEPPLRKRKDDNSHSKNNTLTIED